MGHLKTSGLAVLITAIVACGLLGTSFNLSATRLPDDAMERAPLQDAANLQYGLVVFFAIALVGLLVIKGRDAVASIRW
jgi:hypothetical protein